MSWIGKRLIFNRWLFPPRCEKAIHQSASVHFYQTTTRRSVSLTNENAKVIHVQLQQTKQTDGKEKEWERERSCRKEKKNDADHAQKFRVQDVLALTLSRAEQATHLALSSELVFFFLLCFKILWS